ncbi:MAG TPA: AmmeMemoRadiSam system protein B [Vicinamibacterales bacterium]|jgi:AmmeMemoRadiSam system protein B|nr:AmmeMemoRadiSam system protein B [Vicinamibacterales bacterium]
MNRAAAVAGTWYPGSPGALAREVDGCLAGVRDVPRGDVTAVIAPHAGLMFSGPVGAFSYKAAAASAPYDAAVLVGPSHFVAFEGVALYPDGAFETPFGPVAIDADLADSIRAACDVIHPYHAAHRREHSLEMQLPFIKRLLPDLPIVPLLMGYQVRETILSLASGLAAAAREKRLLLVASTDLSHYFDAATAAALDSRVQAAVGAFDADQLLALFEQYPEHDRGRYVACGGGPAIAVMRAASARGASSARVLRYAHSGEISGDNSGVVGYLAAAFGIFTDVH